MKETTKRVIELRLQGKTYRQISYAVGLSLGTISYLCNKYVTDNDVIYARNRIASRGKDKALAAARVGAAQYYKTRRRERLEFWTEKLRNYSNQSYIYYVAGLYVGEGAKTGTKCSLSNADPCVIAQFIFLAEIVCEALYTTRLHLHQTHDAKACREFWEGKCVRVDAVQQTDTRKQKRNYAARENYGTMRVDIKQPLMLREALLTYSVFGS